MLSLRIVNVDHYMSPPKPGLDLTYSQFRGSHIKSVPVIRIFGSTSSGCKTCLHVHGVFPYILVPHSGADDSSIVYQLASSLDKAINISLGSSYSNRQHVFKIVQVSGRPFYGYHGQDHQFLKIFFYSPLIVKRASDLLQSGAVCGTQFQIHEGHVPFILQFFIDYNLYGMSFIDVKNVVFRKDANPPDILPGALPRESVCTLEADAVAVDILNRLQVEGELAVNPGLAAILKEEQERLQKDALDSSQRPTPKCTVSEVLLKEKLKENLKFQGKCKAVLKERIPYPAETQRSNDSAILDASVLDTHSLSSLVLSNKSKHQVAVVDEELILSLSQHSNSRLSLDKSLLCALDALAEPSVEVRSQGVEDDSILGSQLPPQETCEDDTDALDYTQPASDMFASDSDSDIDQDSDENFEENLPQLDGIDDVFEESKKKSKRKSAKILAENTLNNNFADKCDSFLENTKDSNFWPEPEKHERLDEIFSDDEQFNSPIHSFVDESSSQSSCDYVMSFDSLLTGDPTLTNKHTSFAEDVVADTKDDTLAWDDSVDLVVTDMCTNQEFNGVQDSPLKLILDSSVDLAKEDLSSNNVQLNDLEKCLPSCSDEFLTTSQLDEMFDKDLNKVLENIYESSSQHESDSCTECSERLKYGKKCDILDKNEEVFIKEREALHALNISKKVDRFDSSCSELSEILTESDDDTPAIADSSKLESLSCKTSDNLVVLNSKHQSNDSYINSNKNENPNSRLITKNQEKKKEITKEKSEISRNGKGVTGSVLKSKKLLKSPGKKTQLVVKMFGKHDVMKRKPTSAVLFDDDDDDEVLRYFSQLELVASSLAKREEVSNTEPILSPLWSPLQVTTMSDSNSTSINSKQKRKRNEYSKIMKRLGISKKEMYKITSCFVSLQRLSQKDLDLLSRKFVLNMNLSKSKKSTKPKNVKKLICKKTSHTKKERKSLNCTTSSNLHIAPADNCATAEVHNGKSRVSTTPSSNIASKLIECSVSSKKSVLQNENASLSNLPTQVETDFMGPLCRKKLFSGMKSDSTVISTKNEKKRSTCTGGEINYSINSSPTENSEHLKEIKYPKEESPAVTKEQKAQTLGQSPTKVVCTELSKGTTKEQPTITPMNCKLNENASSNVKQVKSTMPIILLKDCQSSLVKDPLKNPYHLNSLKADTLNKSKKKKTLQSCSAVVPTNSNVPGERNSCFKSHSSQPNACDEKISMKKDTLNKTKKRKTSQNFSEATSSISNLPPLNNSCFRSKTSQSGPSHGMKSLKKDSNKAKKRKTSKNCSEVASANPNLQQENNYCFKSDSSQSNACIEMIDLPIKNSMCNISSVQCKKSFKNGRPEADNKLSSEKTLAPCTSDKNTETLSIDREVDTSPYPVQHQLKSKNKMGARDKNVSSKNRLSSQSNQKENLDNSVLNTLHEDCFVNIGKVSDISSLNRDMNKLDHVNIIKKRSLGTLKKSDKFSTLHRRRSLRVLSLDGAADNSSSDENVELENQNEESSNVCTTPNKKRRSVSKQDLTPKATYSPLSIEIKKSPKMQVEKHCFFRETLDQNADKIGKELVINLTPIESRCDSKNDPLKQNKAMLHQIDGSESEISNIDPEKSTKVDGVELPSSCLDFDENQPSTSTQASTVRNDLKILTKAYPIVKKLKVSIRRLTCESEGSSPHPYDSPKRPAKQSKRSFSLPLTSK